ncbi:MAG TPA: DUF928 domain-containing protein [Allocoleopsis sp.]
MMPATAQMRRYSPPGGSAPRTPGAGGARSGSCAGDANTTFTALAPYGHVGQTAATHPTFAWYVPDRQSLEIDFRLYVYGADNRLQPQPVYRTLLPSTQGFMTFTLPGTEAALSVGQHYYWQAALICDPNHRSEDLIVNAEMQIVESTLPETERWYDLLKSELENTASPSETISDLLMQLATTERSTSEALAQSAETAPEADHSQLLEQSKDILQHSLQLTQIVETNP